MCCMSTVAVVIDIVIITAELRGEKIANIAYTITDELLADGLKVLLKVGVTKAKVLKTSGYM